MRKLLALIAFAAIVMAPIAKAQAQVVPVVAGSASVVTVPFAIGMAAFVALPVLIATNQKSPAAYACEALLGDQCIVELSFPHDPPRQTKSYARNIPLRNDHKPYHTTVDGVDTIRSDG